MRRWAAWTAAMTVLLAGAVAPANAVDEILPLERQQLDVTVTGNRAVPVRLTEPVTLDLTRSGDELAGVSVDLAGALLGERDEFGVALVSRFRNDAIVVAAMFEPDGTPLLASGQTSRLGLPRPVNDTATCVRCEIPAGDYDLFVFGPYRFRADDPAPRVTLRLTGLAEGAAAVADTAGYGAYVIAAASEFGGPASAVGGGGIQTIVAPLFYDGAQRDGVYLSQARVTTSSDPIGGGELSLSAQVNNRPEIPLTGERMPFQDGYSGTAAVVGGAGHLETGLVVPTTLDREIPYLYSHGDTTLVNHSGWTMNVAMLWLTTRTMIFDDPEPLQEPVLDVESQTWGS